MFLLGLIVLICQNFVDAGLVDLDDYASNRCPDRNKISLFTPGPVKTTKLVRQSMAEDIGLAEDRYAQMISYIRKSTMKIGGVSEDDYTAILMQGSGTYGVESAIQTATPKNSSGRVLILTNGYFGHNFVAICEQTQIPHKILQYKDGEEIDLKELQKVLEEDKEFSTVAVVHHETSSGILNPIREIGELVRRYLKEAALVVDAISSFGCIGIDIDTIGIDYLIYTSNKCLQSLPGFSIVIAKKEHLLTTKGNSRSYSLDLYDQYNGFQDSGFFRFTSPIQVLLATRTAFSDLFKEGMENRIQRIQSNSRIIRTSLAKLGFKRFLTDDVASYIITAYHMPKSFHFPEFQAKLQKKGFYIYPTSLTTIPLFRIGHVGDLSDKDCQQFLAAFKRSLKEMRVKIPVE